MICYIILPLQTQSVDVALWMGTSKQDLCGKSHGSTGQAPLRGTCNGARAGEIVNYISILFNTYDI
jgi:hypothetical protein